MVQQFRNEAIDELRGLPYNPYAPRENRGFAPIVPAPKGKVRTSYGGAYGVFWKNMIVQHVLAQEASIEHEGKDPRDRQLNRLQRIKGLRDSPLDQ